jgi:hypothetical protein
MSDDDLDAVVDKIRTMWQEFDGLQGRANAGYQHGMAWLRDNADMLGDTVAPLGNGLSKLYSAIDNALAKIRDDIGQTVQISIDGYEVLKKMKTYNAPWLTASNDANSVATALSNPENRLESYWKGDAAKTYYRIVGIQAKAAQQVGVLADAAAKSLTTIASAGTTFYYALFLALVAMLVALGAAIVALFTVVGAPAGIASIISALGASGAIIYAFVVFTDAQTAEGDRVAHLAVNETGFDPGPAWPRSAVPIDVKPSDPGSWVPVPQPGDPH